MDRMDTIGRADQHMIVTIDRNVITRIPRFSASHDNHRTWFLHLRGAQPEDAGRYMCQVNSNPMITQFGIIDVVGTRSNVNLDVNGESLRLRFTSSSADHLGFRELSISYHSPRGFASSFDLSWRWCSFTESYLETRRWQTYQHGRSGQEKRDEKFDTHLIE